MAVFVESHLDVLQNMPWPENWQLFLLNMELGWLIDFRMISESECKLSSPEPS
jgi:hypothetical protein